MLEAMKQMKNQTPRSGHEFSREITHTVTDHFVDELLTFMKENRRDVLERRDIVDLSRQFKAQDESRCLDSVHKIAGEWFTEVERDYWEQNRRHPFERILVKRFAHLFPPTESLDDEATLSRRLLPGFFIAVEGLAGREFVNQCRGAGRGILRQLREAFGEDFEWKDYYGDAAANNLVDDLLAVMAWNFGDFNHRLDGLCGVVNANLAPPEDYAFEGDAVESWTLHRAGAVAMMTALYADLGVNLGSLSARKDIQRRYGERGMQALQHLVEEIEKAH
jgi:hypothetical protein